MDSKTKKKVTADWNVVFPSLGVYRPMHLLRRAGPLLVGVHLQMSSGQTHYVPVAHVHNLVRQIPVVTLTLATEVANEDVPFNLHSQKYNRIAAQLAAVAAIPIEGELSLDRVVDGYRRYRDAAAVRYQPDLYADPVLLYAWTGRNDDAMNHVEIARATLSQWPDNVRSQIGGVDSWIAALERQAQSLDGIRGTVESQISKLKVDKLPASDIN